MTDEEIELRLALLERQRKRGALEAAPVPVPLAADSGGEVIRLAPGKSRSKVQIEEKWFKTLKTCPHCGKEKNVGKDFGVAVHRGVQYPNSWCKQCRSETSNSYRTKPRKNASKHNPKPPAPRKPKTKK